MVLNYILQFSWLSEIEGAAKNDDDRPIFIAFDGSCRQGIGDMWPRFDGFMIYCFGPQAGVVL